MQRPPRTLQKDHAWGPMTFLGGWAVSYERGTPAFTTSSDTVQHHPPLTVKVLTFQNQMTAACSTITWAYCKCHSVNSCEAAEVLHMRISVCAAIACHSAE